MIPNGGNALICSKTVQIISIVSIIVDSLWQPAMMARKKASQHFMCRDATAIKIPALLYAFWLTILVSQSAV